MSKPQKTGRKKSSTQQEVGLKYGFRSGLEERVAASFADAGYSFTFEEKTIEFTQPAKKRKYTPDFVLNKLDGGEMVVETKGRFVQQDRLKIEMVLKEHPDLDLRILFSNAKAKLSKTSKTTYGDWCDKRGIKWAHKEMPESWTNELMLTDKGLK